MPKPFDYDSLFDLSDLRTFHAPESPWCPQCSCRKNGDGDTPNVVQYEDEDGDRCLNEDCRCHGPKCDECGEHCSRLETIREHRAPLSQPCECCWACRREEKTDAHRSSRERWSEDRFDAMHDGDREVV